jgi:hypothetical protein
MQAASHSPRQQPDECDKLKLLWANAVVRPGIGGRLVLNCSFSIQSDPAFPIAGVAPNIDYPDTNGLYQTAVSAFTDLLKTPLTELQGNILDHRVSLAIHHKKLKLTLFIGAYLQVNHTLEICTVTKHWELDIP